MLITDMIASSAANTPSKAALVFEGQSVSYAEFNALLNQTANGLLSLEIPAPLRARAEEPVIVAILLDNSIEFLQVFLATAKIGWLAAVLDPKWGTAHLNASLHDCNPRVLITDQNHYRRLQPVAKAMQVIFVAGAEAAPPPGEGMDFSDWTRGASATEPEGRGTGQDLFYLGYTSGTTGKPKGFIRSHESWVKSFAVSSSSMFDESVHNRVLAPGPLVHSLSLYAAVHTLFMGGTFYFLRKFAPNRIIAVLSNHPVTHIYLVPTMFEAIFQAGLIRPEPFIAPGVKGIISSGDKWLAKSKQTADKLFPNAKLFEFYGASELSFVSILAPVDHKCKPDSVGRPVRGVEISIRDARGFEVKPGEVGELFVKSRMVFAGYYRDPEATRRVLQDGFATVGDLVRQDEDGYLYLVGRRKNMIISGGLNIYPEEVERVLRRLPEIMEVAVIGVPDPYWGQKVVALITSTPESIVDESRIKSHCREHMASYKCPKAVVQVDALPHTTSGKIARNVIMEKWQGGGWNL